MPQTKKFKDQPKKSNKDGTDYTDLEAKEQESDTIGTDEKKLILAQVEAEYKQGYDHIAPKREQWYQRLKLFNNQKRDDTAVGETLMFTVFQTVLASLYNDSLDSEFIGRVRVGDEAAGQLTQLARYDFDEMEKDEIDYAFDWDTCFFGRGLLMFNEFDRESMHPVPEVMDPMTVVRDPHASSVNGNSKGRGAARFLGREVFITKREMEEHGAYINLDKLNQEKDNQQINSLIDEGREARDEAQNRQGDVFGGDSGEDDNKEYQLLEWFTHWKGYKVLLVTDQSKQEIFRFQYLLDAEDTPAKDWPIIDRPLYPTSHDWDGASIPDFTEDKQRAMAVIQNLSIASMKADLYPMYLYDKLRITKKSDLNFGFNKMIGVNGAVSAGVVQPMNKANPNVAMADYILRTLDASAQKATATPEIQQGGMSDEQRTLGELNLIASKTDTRYSLTLKIFGWSERRFWRQWYQLYKTHFVEHIDEKVIRISGAFGNTWKTLTRENIISDVDPDVKIESKAVAEGERMRKAQKLEKIAGILLQDPTSNRRYLLKTLAKLYGMSADEVTMILPPTPDELKAHRENEILGEDTMTDKETGDVASVSTRDNHIIHLEVHSLATDTPATRAHIKTHKEAMRVAQEQPELLPEDQQAAQAEQEGTSPGEATQSPEGLMGLLGKAQQGLTPSQGGV